MYTDYIIVLFLIIGALSLVFVVLGIAALVGERLLNVFPRNHFHELRRLNRRQRQQRLRQRADDAVTGDRCERDISTADAELRRAAVAARRTP